MKCEACNDKKNQIKAGKTKAGAQKYKCKICGKYYVPEGKKRGYSEEIKKQAIKLYLEGNSSRAVGRILGIGKKELLNLHTSNEIPVHKQQKRVLNHLQILRIAVGFSGNSRKIVTQKSVHALNGVRVCISSEMFGSVDENTGMPMVRCIKFCINMANFIC